MTRKTKICFISPQAYVYFSPDTEGVPGGSERQLCLLGIELSKDTTYEVHYCVADYGQEEKTEEHGNVKVWK